MNLLMNETKQLDERATGLAKRYLQTEAELLEVLIEMRKKRVFAELNYSGIFEYCEQRLKLSRAQSYYFKSVAEKSDEVPEINQAIQQGELTLSQARRIVTVITPENKNEWIEKAKTLKQSDLEREVNLVNPKAYANASELKVTVTRETEGDIKVIREILAQKFKRQPSLDEVIAYMAKLCREKLDPEERATKSRKVSFLGHVKPGRHAIRNSVKHQVVKRMGWQCGYLGGDGRRCVQKRWLQFHHMREVSRGGLNTADNLTLLCHNHHAHHHSAEESLGRRKFGEGRIRTFEGRAVRFTV